MLTPYGILLSGIPVGYSAPFSHDLYEEDIHDAAHPVTAAHSSAATKSDASQHDKQRHLHLDLSKGPHLPSSFGSFHSIKAAHVSHPHHWAPASYAGWPRFLSHGPAFHTTQNTSWAPPADIRQTPDRYLIDIEVPGLSKEDEKSILVQWMSPRTIIVSAEIKRPAVPPPQLVQIHPAEARTGDDLVNVSTSDAEDGGPVQRTVSHRSKAPTGGEDGEPAEKAQDNATTFLARERHAGYWRRSFTLPEDANLGLDPDVSGSGPPPSYTLEAGVLSIEIPRNKATQK